MNWLMVWKTLYKLCIGAKVMLRENKAVKCGLVNGAIGYINVILYDDDTGLPQLPTFIIVKFDNMYGFEEFDGGIPLVPTQTSWCVGSKSLASKQYHLFMLGLYNSQLAVLNFALL